VPVDPRTLKPTELVRLLNSKPLGEVISERRLHSHCSRAGFRIGDGRHVDLLRYVPWLELERHRSRPEAEGLTGYEGHKERARQRNLELPLSGRDIDELPAVVNPDRKTRAERDFRFLCEQYIPQTLYLRWSPDHLKVIVKIEQAVLEGGLFAMARPRSFAHRLPASPASTNCAKVLLHKRLAAFVVVSTLDERTDFGTGCTIELRLPFPQPAKRTSACLHVFHHQQEPGRAETGGQVPVCLDLLVQQLHGGLDLEVDLRLTQRHRRLLANLSGLLCILGSPSERCKGYPAPGWFHRRARERLGRLPSAAPRHDRASVPPHTCRPWSWVSYGSIKRSRIAKRARVT